IAGKENRLELDLDSCRLLDTDFQFSCGYSYAGEKYYPSTPPQWFISTRVLLAILEQKSKGLEIISYIRPRKFIPYCEPIS
ncbi:MAG: hypothetical protein KDA65_13610, partial [Planctomycetaceae bacterium]|nr:hypothetical protein [Planctomycetaceae bacterium]